MNKIKAIRKNKGWTQKTFAEYLGIPLITYVQWENGSRKAPPYVLELIKYKCRTDTNQIELDIQRKEYACFSIDKKGLTGVFRTTLLESVEKWKENIGKKEHTAWIETSIIINTEEVL